MSFVSRSCFQWQLRTHTLLLGERTRVMGIVNVTPDSFSDGGDHAATERAVSHALRLLDEGADIVDIGGESTRPGAPALTEAAVSTAQEQDRVLPVIEGVLHARPGALVSVDTYRAATARAAVQAGAQIVNDVSGGLWDSDMFTACAELRCGTIVMHTRGLPSEWGRQQPLPASMLLPTLLEELGARLSAATGCGIVRERIVADPGFGFGKRGAENWALLAAFSHFPELGFPLLAGLSRKGFLTSALPSETMDSKAIRDELTHASDTAAVLAGAHLVRVHDVRGAVNAAGVADTILAAHR